MDEYIDNNTWKLRGYFPVNFMVIKDIDGVFNLLRMFPRQNFREHYFNDKKIDFENIVMLFAIAIFRLSPRMFRMLMETEWCKYCEFIDCEISPGENSFHISLHFESCEMLSGCMNLPLGSHVEIDKKLISKNFKQSVRNRNLYTLSL